MTYATSDAIWVTPPRLRTPCSQATVWSGRVDNTTNVSQEEICQLFIYSEHWIYFHFIYYPLCVLIMQVYHDYGRMRDFGRVPNSTQNI
jgi:hypothetical protein